MLDLFFKLWFLHNNNNNSTLDSLAAIQSMKLRLKQEKSPYLKVETLESGSTRGGLMLLMATRW